MLCTIQGRNVMNFKINYIGSGLQEMSVDSFETGTLNKAEAMILAEKMVSVAEDFLWNCKEKQISDMCGSICSELQVKTGEVAA